MVRRSKHDYLRITWHRDPHAGRAESSALLDQGVLIEITSEKWTPSPLEFYLSERSPLGRAGGEQGSVACSMLRADEAPQSRPHGVQDAVSHRLGDTVPAKNRRPWDRGVATDCVAGGAEISSRLVY